MTPDAPRRADNPWLLAACSVVIAILAWPVKTITPGTGIDPSWSSVLHVAARAGLQFGRDISFTYGPLGFLNIPKLYFLATGVMAVAFAAALTGAVAATAMWLFGRSLRPLPAFCAAWLVVTLCPLEPAELFPILIVVWCLIVARRTDEPLPMAIAAALGVLAATALLIKFSAGLITVPIVLIASGSRGRRSMGAAAAAFLVALPGLWVVAGGAIGNLPRFFTESWQITSGYSEALSTAAPPRNAAVDYLIALVFGGALLVAGWLRNGRRLFAPALAIVAIALAFEAKHAFVRHDGGHVASLLILCIFAPIAWWRPGGPNRALGAITIAALVFFYGSALVYNDAEVSDELMRVNPVGLALRFARQATTLAVPGRARQHIERSRAATLEKVGVDRATRAELDHHTVHVDPTETDVIWALDAPWHSPPVFQMYSSYTAHLDRENAEFLASADAPERMLRPNDAASVDYHWGVFESPAYVQSLVCHYELRTQFPFWQVLERVPNRCAAPRALSPARPVRNGDTVDVPLGATRDLVTARLVCRPDVLYRLTNLAWRPRHFARVKLDDRDWRRLIVATASNGLLLRAPNDRLPGNSVDYTVNRLRFANLPGPCTLRFWAQPML